MISQTAEYALRAVVCMGLDPDNPMTTQVIAERVRVPAGYLSKVLQALSRARIVDSRRGLRGGYTLAVPLDRLTILQVINAVDPVRRILKCPLGLPSHDRLCALHQRLDDGIAYIEALFGRTTLAELLSQPNPCHPLCEEVMATFSGNQGPGQVVSLPAPDPAPRPAAAKGRRPRPR